jgi:hypothetical protein
LVALAAGVVGAVVGMLVLATADGGPGTGNGVVGGYAGVMFGLIASSSAGPPCSGRAAAHDAGSLKPGRHPPGP